MDLNTIRDLVIVLVPMILSLTVHEYAHAWSAFRLGDDTASRQGRLTLNPGAHIDPLGTLVIPAISVLAGGISLIGWARPVPVSPYRFRRGISMRNGMMITALAGPASNILLAVLFGGVLMALYSGDVETLSAGNFSSRVPAVWYLGQNDNVAMILSRVFFLNLSLAVFNMLPVAPLDGSRLLPLDLQEKMMRYQMLVFLGLILLINFAGQFLVVPIGAVGNAILAFFSVFF